jgi:hypothetical protein
VRAQLVKLQVQVGKVAEAMETLRRRIEEQPSTELDCTCQMVELLHESGQTSAAKDLVATIPANLHEKLNDERWLLGHGLFGPYKYEARHWNEMDEMFTYGRQNVEARFIKSWDLLEPLLAAQRQAVSALDPEVCRRWLTHFRAAVAAHARCRHLRRRHSIG